MADSSNLLSIGAFSLITRLTPKALRFYEEKRLLVPVKKEITGYRIYSFDQIRKGLLLHRLADLGFGVRDMQTILDVVEGRTDRSAVDALIAGRIAEVRSQVSELEKVREDLENKTFEEIIDMQSEEMKVKDVPALRVVSLREKGRYDEVTPRLIGELFGMIVGQHNQQVRICGAPMSIYHDPECKEGDADIEVAIPISGRITVDTRFEIKTLDSVKVLSVMHRGAYPKVGETWERAFRLMSEKGYAPAGPGRELYLNDPHDTPESELLTEVQVPIG